MNFDISISKKKLLIRVGWEPNLFLRIKRKFCQKYLNKIVFL